MKLQTRTQASRLRRTTLRSKPTFSVRIITRSSCWRTSIKCLRAVRWWLRPFRNQRVAPGFPLVSSRSARHKHSRCQMDLFDELESRVVCGDGAIGMLLLNEGIPIDRCLEELCVSQPDRIFGRDGVCVARKEKIERCARNLFLC